MQYGSPSHNTRARLFAVLGALLAGAFIYFSLVIPIENIRAISELTFKFYSSRLGDGLFSARAQFGHEQKKYNDVLVDKLLYSSILRCPEDNTIRHDQSQDGKPVQLRTMTLATAEAIYSFQIDHLLKLSHEVKPQDEIVAVMDKRCMSSFRAFLGDSISKMPFLAKAISVKIFLVDKNSGDEFRTLFVLSDWNIFFTKSGEQEVKTEAFDFSFYDFTYRNFSRFYKWHEASKVLQKRKLETATKLVYIKPGHELIRSHNWANGITQFHPVFHSLESYDSVMKRLILFDPYSLQKLVRVFTEEKFQTLQKGRMVFPDELSHSARFTSEHEKLEYMNWYKSMGNDFQRQFSIYKIFSVDESLIADLRSINFMFINFSKLESNILDSINDKAQGNNCLMQLSSGYLFTLPSDSVEVNSEILLKNHDQALIGEFDKLELLSLSPNSLKRCMDSRHLLRMLTRSQAMMKSFSNRKYLDFSNKYIFNFRTHIYSNRIRRTIEKWSQDLAQIGVAFVTHFTASTDRATASSLGSIRSFERPNSYHFATTNGSETSFLVPLEALNMVALADEEKIIYKRKLMGTLNYNDTYVFGYPLHSKETLWLWCQLTWAPLFSHFMLDMDARGLLLDPSKDPKYFWLIDYDVAFTGNISTLIKLTDNYTADFLAPSFGRTVGYKTLMDLENAGPEFDVKWLWWRLAKLWSEHMGKGMRPDLTSQQAKAKARRSYAAVMRLSTRMVFACLESMFLPTNLNWGIDETFFHTVCEFMNCSFVPFSAIPLGEAGTIRNGSELWNMNSTDMKKLGVQIEDRWIDNIWGEKVYAPVMYELSNPRVRLPVSWLSTFFTYRTYNKHVAVLEDYVNRSFTLNQIWHPMKEDRIFAREYWLNNP